VGFSYRKSFKAGPFRVTTSKSGISYSAGVKGARITKRADGRVQTTLSVPHTGLRHTTTTASAKAKAASRRKPSRPQASSNSASLPGHRSTVLPYPPPAGTPPLPFKSYLAKVTLRPDRIQIDRTFLGRVNGNHSASIPWPPEARSLGAGPSRSPPGGSPAQGSETGGVRADGKIAQRLHATVPVASQP
jgi:Protein of unknown function (DUF4236)